MNSVFSEQEYEQLVLNTRRMLREYSDIRGIKRVRFETKNLLNCLYGNERYKINRYSWKTALMANALSDAGEYNEIKRYIRKWKHIKYQLCEIDDVQNGLLLLKLYRQNGEYKELMDKLCEFCLNKSRDSQDSIPYRSNTEDIYVDYLGMVCPFLFAYAKEFNDTEVHRLAFKQIENFIKYARDEKTGLVYHGYNYKENTTKGELGWGRGMGWVLMGIAESIEYIDKTSDEYRLLKEYLRVLANAVINYQRNDGYFTWSIADKEAHIDTSATSMIIYALCKGVEQGVLDASFIVNIELGAEALHRSYKDGKIYDGSGECGGFGKYSKDYGVYPWVMGTSIALINSIKKIQKTESGNGKRQIL